MNFILPYKEAEEILREDIKQIKETGFFDFKSKTPVYSTKKALEEKGIMLGLLIARTKSGERVVLRAFSGALNSSYLVEGYTPPCFSVKAFEEVVSEFDSKIHCYTDRIELGESDLIPTRRQLSNECLEKIKELYTFYTIKGKLKLNDIKELNYTTGMGDCATIKLLSFCFKKGFTPISLAEIFFGKESESRKADQIYPPCDEKCKPLIKYLFNINLLYSDEDIAIINKDAGLLSTPGKGEDKYDSASVRIKALFPDSPELPSVHRLDMDTSGIMVFAKNESAKRNISMQFEERKTKKVYEALLRGSLMTQKGTIKLPIRLDINNRPYQIVDFENGKEAITDYERVKIEILNGEKVSRVLFFPHTGRTHQIRVHAASGLMLPIVGDRLYGERKEGERLCLHAKSLSFIHPTTGERVTFEEEPDF